MGQKVHPHGMRLGIIRESSSKWFAKGQDYVKNLHDDIKVRHFLFAEYKQAGINDITIERPGHNAHVTIYCARPGVIIGKKGADVDSLRREIAAILQVKTHVTIEEVRKPDLAAKLVAESIAQQLERRVAFRKAMKRAIQSAMRGGAQGIKVSISGRLGGAEIARTEWSREGRIPLHTFRADIDYNTAEALTTYGIIGVKVWIFKGEVMKKRRSVKQATGEK